MINPSNPILSNSNANNSNLSNLQLNDFLQLPLELLCEIFSGLSDQDCSSVSLTCKKFNDVLNSKDFKILHLKKILKQNSTLQIKEMIHECCYATNPDFDPTKRFFSISLDRYNHIKCNCKQIKIEDFIVNALFERDKRVSFALNEKKWNLAVSKEELHSSMRNEQERSHSKIFDASKRIFYSSYEVLSYEDFQDHSMESVKKYYGLAKTSRLLSGKLIEIECLIPRKLPNGLETCTEIDKKIKVKNQQPDIDSIILPQSLKISLGIFKIVNFDIQNKSFCINSNDKKLNIIKITITGPTDFTSKEEYTLLKSIDLQNFYKPIKDLSNHAYDPVAKFVFLCALNMSAISIISTEDLSNNSDKQIKRTSSNNKNETLDSMHYDPKSQLLFLAINHSTGKTLEVYDSNTLMKKCSFNLSDPNLSTEAKYVVKYMCYDSKNEILITASDFGRVAAWDIEKKIFIASKAKLNVNITKLSLDNRRIYVYYSGPKSNWGYTIYSY
jgi:hypothetical protein